MKFVSYILAFYLILLSVVPCCSFDECKEEITEVAADHEDEPKDCGNCSPFFSCEGCATATISFLPAQFGIAPLIISAVYPEFFQGSLPDIDYDFWQPPKHV